MSTLLRTQDASTDTNCPTLHGAVPQAHQTVGGAEDRLSDVPYIRMRDAFIRWNVFGCFNAAAEYAEARTAWELALMEQGDRG